MDPRRRIDQHNGVLDGGAKKTSKKRPWEMVLVVYGFPSQVAALRFEWCWQNPAESLLTRNALSGMPKAQQTKERLAAKIRVLYEMVHVAPFSRFPLNVFWLLKDKEKFRVLLEGCPSLPKHVSVFNACNMGSGNGMRVSTIAHAKTSVAVAVIAHSQMWFRFRFFVLLSARRLAGAEQEARVGFVAGCAGARGRCTGTAV